MAEINQKALELLDDADEKPEFALKCMAEVRNQIKLFSDIHCQLFAAAEAQRFMAFVKESLKNASPDVYRKFINLINEDMALRSAMRLY